MSLSQLSSDQLIDEIETRGYYVIVEDEALAHFGDQELLDEIERRNYVDIVRGDDFETMKTTLEDQGYHVFERDQQKELLEEMYWHILGEPYSRVLQYMNGLFINKIGRWV